MLKVYNIAEGNYKWVIVWIVFISLAIVQVKTSTATETSPVNYVNRYTRALDVYMIDGTYQGKNIFVRNPFNKEAMSYNVNFIQINNQLVKKVNQSRLELDLTRFKTGDYVKIEIYYNGVRPKVENPNDLVSHSTFELVSSKLTQNGVIWTTRNESSSEPFYVERLVSNKWAPVGKTIGKGSPETNTYSLEVKHHSGENVYRIKQRDAVNNYRYSSKLSYFSDKDPITAFPEIFDNQLVLTGIAEYKLFDGYGKLVDHGEARIIETSDFKKGVYYLAIENRMKRVIKR